MSVVPLKSALQKECDDLRENYKGLMATIDMKDHLIKSLMEEMMLRQKIHSKALSRILLKLSTNENISQTDLGLFEVLEVKL